MFEVYNISMWKEDERIFTNRGLGFFENVQSYLNSLAPETFGYPYDPKYHFVVKYVLRDDLTASSPFVSVYMNTADKPEINMP